jgi:hypothetical protein
VTEETRPGQPDPVPPRPADERDPQPDDRLGPASPQPFTPPGYGQPGAPSYGQPGAQPYGQPGPASPPPGQRQPGAPSYGQPGTPSYGQPGRAAPPPFPPPPPGYGPPGGQRGYGQPSAAGYRAFPPPPPGYGPPRYGQPGYGQPGYGGWNVTPAPGGVPLRPLGLGDIYNGAITLARRNPAATFGLTAIVMTIYGVAGALLERLYTSDFAHFRQTFQPGQQPTQQQVNDLVSSVVGEALPAILALGVLAFIAHAALTGLLSAVIGRGILGQKVGLGQAWRAGRVGAVARATMLLFLLGIAVWVPVVAIVVVTALLHLTPVAILVGVVGGIGTFVFWVLFVTRLSLTLPAVVLERVPARMAMRRSWRISQGSFWRLFGIQLLTFIVVAVAADVLSIPFFVGEVLLGGSGGSFLTVSASTSILVLIVSIVGSVITATITRPFSAGVSVLLYADLRMRREGLDLLLRDAAQNQALTGDEFSAVWQPPTARQAPPAAW